MQGVGASPALGRPPAKKPVAATHAAGDRAQLRAFTAQVSALGRHRKWQALAQLLGELRRCEMELDVIACGAVICAGGRGWESALVPLTDLRVHGLEVDVVAYNAAVSACDRSGHSGQDRVAGGDRGPVGDVLADAASFVLPWRRAGALLRSMRELAVVADTIGLNAAVSCSARSGHWCESFALLAHMQERVLEADHVTCGSAVNSCAVAASAPPHGDQRGRLWERSVGLVFVLQARYVEANEIVLNAVIGACAKGDRWSAALAAFDCLRHGGLEADAVGHSSAASAFCASGRWNRALALLAAARALRAEADTVAHGAVASACERGERWEMVVFIATELAAAWSINADSSGCNAAVVSCEKAGQWVQALAAYLKQRTRGSTAAPTTSEAFAPDAIACKAAIGACERGQQAELGQELLKHLGESVGSRSLPATAWALAKLSASGTQVRNFLAAAVFPALAALARGGAAAGGSAAAVGGPPEVAALAVALATLGAREPTALAALSDLLGGIVGEVGHYALHDLSKLLRAAASLPSASLPIQNARSPQQPLFAAVAAAFVLGLAAFDAKDLSRGALAQFSDDVLGVIWVLAFVGHASEAPVCAASSALLVAGRALDALGARGARGAAGAAQQAVRPSSRLTSQIGGSSTRRRLGRRTTGTWPWRDARCQRTCSRSWHDTGPSSSTPRTAAASCSAWTCHHQASSWPLRLTRPCSTCAYSWRQASWAAIMWSSAAAVHPRRVDAQWPASASPRAVLSGTWRGRRMSKA